MDELAALEQLLHTLVHHLASYDEEERYDALDELAELIDGAFGEDGVVVGRAVREGGGIDSLALLIIEPDRDVALQVWDIYQLVNVAGIDQT